MTRFKHRFKLKNYLDKTLKVKIAQTGFINIYKNKDKTHKLTIKINIQLYSLNLNRYVILHSRHFVPG